MTDPLWQAHEQGPPEELARALATELGGTVSERDRAMVLDTPIQELKKIIEKTKQTHEQWKDLNLWATDDPMQ